MKSQKFYAIVRDKYSPDEWHFLSSEYRTKKAFLEDLKANGFAVMNNKIYTEEEYHQLDK